MPYAPQITYEQTDAEARRLWDEQIRDHGRMTNMKRTLAHSGAALRAYMEWYPLKDEVAEFTGERAAILFAHAISVENDCLICSTFFRRILQQWGEDPDQLTLDEQDKLLVAYGQALARDARQIPSSLMEELQNRYTAAQLVSLTAFGGIMVATNLFNDALQIPLDEYLYTYRQTN